MTPEELEARAACLDLDAITAWDRAQELEHFDMPDMVRAYERRARELERQAADAWEQYDCAMAAGEGVTV